ncbi:HNH endonuclease [Acinetobacter lwoffii]|uniref:HNH endonuclease n=1 Tax=Acinetobacter lwoffii TaxID=28090 RepID=UPI001FB48644|nr:HNH endonuclease [Acinetobacter lwoffii]MCJ0927908.1 HNH endonuclease [Acinetobacter lwoffii]
MRDAKRLAAIRKLPCVRCGNPNSQAAHSNSAKHGKGRGIKASDLFVIPLCAICHAAFDRFELGNRAESEAMFDQWLVRVERMLNQTDKEIF